MRLLGPVFASALVCAVFAAPASAALESFDAAFPAVPVVGEPATLEISAQDAAAPLTGVTVDYGDGEGGQAETACGVGQKNRERRSGRRETFELTHEFASALPHTVTITVSTGGCVDQPVKTTRTLLVTPLGALELPPGVQPPPGPVLPPLPVDLPGRALGRTSAACADADMTPTASTLGRARKAIQCLVNAERTAAGLKATRRNRRLERAARRHTNDMLERGYFDHQGPNGPNLAARLRKARYRFDIAGENLGGGWGTPATPRQVVVAWMASTGHRANILQGRFTQAGVGVGIPFPGKDGQGTIYTQDFGRP